MSKLILRKWFNNINLISGSTNSHFSNNKRNSLDIVYNSLDRVNYTYFAANHIRTVVTHEQCESKLCDDPLPTMPCVFRGSECEMTVAIADQPVRNTIV